MIAIIQGCGANLASIQFALERLSYKITVTADPKIIAAASHVILPGVGHAAIAMAQLQKLNLITVIQQLQQPVLGICLGMQLLYDSSAEGDVTGLGIIPGNINALPTDAGLTVPHMGWNTLSLLKSSLLTAELTNGIYQYFVHSFAAPVNEFTIAATHYGNAFTAIVQRNNFYGTQFHPERSGKMGEVILKNFLRL